MKISESQKIGEQPGDSTKVVYQLQFKPNQIKLDQASKEAEIVQRLDKLENIFGMYPDKMVNGESFIIELFYSSTFKFFDSLIIIFIFK